MDGTARLLSRMRFAFTGSFHTIVPAFPIAAKVCRAGTSGALREALTPANAPQDAGRTDLVRRGVDLAGTPEGAAAIPPPRNPAQDSES